jgi:hypothetical protein
MGKYFLTCNESELRNIDLASEICHEILETYLNNGRE